MGNEGFTYVLESGDEASIHLDQVLEYNADPTTSATPGIASSPGRRRRGAARVARGLADLAQEGGLHDADATIAALCGRLSALPEAEREAAVRSLVTVALEGLRARLAAVDLREAGRAWREMLGKRYRVLGEADMNKRSSIGLATLSFVLGILVRPTLFEFANQLKDWIIPSRASLRFNLVHDGMLVHSGLLPAIELWISNVGDAPTLIKRIEICFGPEIIVRDYSGDSPRLRYDNPEDRDSIRALLMQNNLVRIATCFTEARYPELISDDRELLPGRSKRFLFESVRELTLKSTLQTGRARVRRDGGECSLTVYGSNMVAVSQLFLCERSDVGLLHQGEKTR